MAGGEEDPLFQAEEFMLELLVDQLDTMGGLARSETFRAECHNDLCC